MINKNNIRFDFGEVYWHKAQIKWGLQHLIELIEKYKQNKDFDFK